MTIKGGRGVWRLMAKTILNFHFDCLIPSLNDYGGVVDVDKVDADNGDVENDDVDVNDWSTGARHQVECKVYQSCGRLAGPLEREYPLIGPIRF